LDCRSLLCCRRWASSPSPWCRMNQCPFSLERGDERLGHGVVKRGSRPPHRGEDAVALFRISLSCLRTLFSRLSLASSSFSSVVSPSRSPSSISCCSLQFLKVCSETSSSREIWARGFAEERMSLMASSLNSGGYGGLVGGTRTTPFRESPSHNLQVST
jgi:hypothetical protein